jgi:hypothetical protein
MLCCSVGIQIYTYFTLSFVLGVKLLLSLVFISVLYISGNVKYARNGIHARCIIRNSMKTTVTLASVF